MIPSKHTIKEARAHAAIKNVATSIIEIEPSSPEIGKYLCIKGRIEIFRSALNHMPIPEIKNVLRVVVDLEAEKKETEEQAAMKVLRADIEAGVAFRVVEIAPAYNSELKWARRLTDHEKTNYSELFKELGLSGYYNTPKIEVEEKAVWLVINRKSDGEFLGCTNQAWTVNENEWNEIIRLSTEILKGEKITENKSDEAEQKDIENKIATGFCFSCETWCNGDCGDYSNDPIIMQHMYFANTMKEQSYSIND